MIYLNSTSMKLQAVLSSAANTTQPSFHVFFHDVPSQVKPEFSAYRGAVQRGALNDTTDVDICDAPTVGNTTRCVESVAIHNRSLDTEIVTVKTDDGTERIIIQQTLLTLESLHYEHGEGWYVAGA